MSEVSIGGIVIRAPLWNKATEGELLAIVESLSSASYHYADDRGKEWGAAGACVSSAAAECNRLRDDMKRDDDAAEAQGWLNMMEWRG